MSIKSQGTLRTSAGNAVLPHVKALQVEMFEVVDLLEAMEEAVLRRVGKINLVPSLLSKIV